MQELEFLPEPKQTETLKLITKGRITGVPHVVEVRYASLNGSFYVLTNSARADWVRNALAQRECRAKISQHIYPIAAIIASSPERSKALETFRKKYGSRVAEQWYQNPSICIRLDPLGPASIRGSIRGEHETLVSFNEWKNQGNNYLSDVRTAFDSASEEYDYTISRNYVNSWIRKRSINELTRITGPNDTLLEIGCGTGSEAIRLSRKVGRIVATDISEKMLEILRKKVRAKRLEEKILAKRARASEIGTVKELLPDGEVRVAYSFNGALNCEPDIDDVPVELSRVIRKDGYFLCSIRNTLCLSETLSHIVAFQFNKTTTRKHQPTMVSVGGMDIPSCYYSPSRLARIFRPHFRVRKMIGLPSLLPPAYLSNQYLRIGKPRFALERLEFALSGHFPFNRLGDQTLFVFQRG